MKNQNSKRNRNSIRSTRRAAFSKLTVAALAIVIVGLILGQGSFLKTSLPGVTTNAQSGISDNKTIDPEVLKQIQALIQEKESRTAEQQKIDSRLLYEIKMSRGEAIAPLVDRLETGLTVDAQGLIDVEITANVDEGLIRVLKRAGWNVLAILPEYHSITASIPISEIESLAARSEVIFIQPRVEAMMNRSTEYPAKNPLISDVGEIGSLNFLKIRSGVSFATRAARVREFLTERLTDDQLTGATNSEADTTHRAAVARTVAGVNGAGIKIGVMSNGVDSLAARQAAGELPAGLTVLAGQAGTGDEGTAMLELVYDLAPGAQLFYATALPSNAQFATNIKALRTAGCDIIIDDVSYFNESPFQNGQAASVVSPGNAGAIAQAVNDVTIGPQAGALYFSSAANSGNKNDGTAGAWEGDFVSGGATSPPMPAGSVHDFGGGVTLDPLLTAGRVTLKWSDPIGGSGNDYDLFVLNAANTAVAASSTNIQSGTQDPYEDVGNRTAGQRVVIVKKTAAANRFLHLNANGGVLTTSTAGVIYGHNGGVNTISVAATPAGPAQQNLAAGPFPNAHSATNSVEQFSSDGPRRIFYNADSTAITPGNVSSTGGQLLQKPDITAADGTTTTTPGFIPFFGTSAAAPHAGALMALLKQASPASTRTQLYNAMINSAIDIEAPGVDRDSGAGIFMPLLAMNSLGVSGPAFLETGTITTTEFRGNGNGRPEPGEVIDLNLPLKNLGLANATAISAALTTSTAGVSVLNGLAPVAVTYPNIPAAVGSAVPAIPFRFGLDNTTFVCGSTISFTLTVNYAGGASPSQVFNFSVITSPTITTTLDTTPPPAGGGYASTTGTQTGRLVRNGTASSCAVPKVSPGQNDATVGRRYDAYTFTASATGCTTVTLNGSITLFVAAYNNSGFVPGNTTTNYLADAGLSGATTSFSFTATAGQAYTIVVHEVNVGGGLGTNYTLNVNGPIANACSLAPTAAGVEISGRVSTVEGRAVRNAIVTLNDRNGASYAGRSNPFGYYVLTDVPSGETYVASVMAKGLVFNQRVVSVVDNVSGFDFVAEP